MYKYVGNMLEAYGAENMEACGISEKNVEEIKADFQENLRNIDGLIAKQRFVEADAKLTSLAPNLPVTEEYRLNVTIRASIIEQGFSVLCHTCK
jgi:phage FluMu gp28-like protein